MYCNTGFMIGLLYLNCIYYTFTYASPKSELLCAIAF
jgi:hypothetical protein